MRKAYWPVIPLAALVAGCSTMGRITVKDYTAASGQRVMAGQAEPKSEYQCQKLVEEAHDWGMKESMNKAAAIEKLTQTAVEAAPGKSANYAYLHLPGEANVGALNVNAFNDPEVIYYQCASLPAPK
ncbi:MAG TPA: hypothetical protein VJ299_13795 [Steroidobacteraceae bacterium]|jgi:hypothetical protein|nr:hypothetical protein [Steroidobacteraceae bacterium]